jgi:predicted nucleic acid-binding protein
MRVLLDTNIIVHREASTVVRKEIGVLFNWLDRLHYTKCIHPLSINEIEKHQDPKVVATFKIKLANYTQLKTLAQDSPPIQQIRLHDNDQNAENDTSLLNEVFAKRVDLLITEDRGIHSKAHTLGIASQVFTIDDFLEKVTAEHPELTSYRVLAVKTEMFGNVNLNDPFFDSFKSDYKDFSNGSIGKLTRQYTSPRLIREESSASCISRLKTNLNHIQTSRRRFTRDVDSRSGLLR